MYTDSLILTYSVGCHPLSSLFISMLKMMSRFGRGRGCMRRTWLLCDLVVTRGCYFPSSDHLLRSLEVDIRKGQFDELSCECVAMVTNALRTTRPVATFQCSCLCLSRVFSPAGGTLLGTPPSACMVPPPQPLLTTAFLPSVRASLQQLALPASLGK